ncbi:SSL2 DNA or RNA helicases of superfamily II [uncultured Caudovirales phage]|uniref:SSL2 DNA or RNA helicases of superfamily II n=1 Tax=uncultured Caudovirales phage TaxID=2100421 RepID=A0A6J5QBS7_9CAUD|nr:SSL2 DNA or RNA helicases of superfamily II [uncultured Caudovirales phage]
MEVIQLKKISETYNKVICDPGVAYELRDHFTFDVPGAKFMPAYRNKMWDGKIRLFNHMSCQLYSGLQIYLEKFCRDRNYQLEYLDDFAADNFSISEAKEFAKYIKLPEKYQPRDYQLDAFAHAVRNRRGILLSPTGSGKSFIIYLLMRYYHAKISSEKNSCRTLIIVPTTSLVSQLSTDFADYGFDSSDRVHLIVGGVDKQTERQVVISTWQSIYKLDKKWFDQFDLVIGDEVHLFTAKSLQTIMQNLGKCRYRFGTTGTLDGTKTNRMVLEGLFGPVKKVTTTAQLIEDKHLSPFKIKAIVLQYPDSVRMMIKGMDYQQELDFIVTCQARNKFIQNLTLSLKGNTLVLFQFVEKHGKILYKIISEAAPAGRSVYFIYGNIHGDEREQIRKIVEKEQDAIIIASSGTFSTGVNIRNLHNVIFSSPSKSRVRNLQSIGRVLRTSENKEMATLFDIADEMTWQKSENTTIRHFRERLKIYNEEQFNHKIYPVKLEV